MENIVNISPIKRTLWYPLFHATPYNRPAIYILLIILAIIGLYYQVSDSRTFIDALTKKIQGDEFGLVLEIITLFVVFAVWYSDLNNDWKNSLKKFLSVNFVYGDQIKIRCNYAPLISEEDIRQMAQSIGQSVNFGERLPIAPLLQSVETRIQQDQNKTVNDGIPFIHYIVTIKLTQNITALMNPKNPSNCLELQDGTYVEWLPPFEPITAANIKRC